MTKAEKATVSRIRHPFLYELHYGNGTTQKLKAWATVIQASQEVEIILNEDHVLRSMQVHGVGNTSSCSVAICTYDHVHAFPHQVEGHIDFTYSRAFVVTKHDKSGLPCECVAYEHHAKWIAKLNDTEGGQTKLLNRIRKNGPISILLKPYRKRSATGRPGAHRKTTGARSPLQTLRGAKLRYATAQLGAMPAPFQLPEATDA